MCAYWGTGSVWMGGGMGVLTHKYTRTLTDMNAHTHTQACMYAHTHT